MKIAIIGTHGTFKSTLAFCLAGELKKNRYTVRLLEEFAGKCPYPINGQDIRAQEWIVGMQYISELEALAGSGGRKSADIVVCDRSILDSYVYTQDLCRKKSIDMPAWIQTMTYSNMPSYDLLFKTSIVPGGLVNDGTRCIEPEWQDEIECLLNEALTEMKIPYHPLDYTLLKGIKKPTSDNLDTLAKEHVGYMIDMINKKW